MGRKTIKSLCRENEVNDIFQLAYLWHYWIACNNNDKQSVNDYKSLRKEERKAMADFLFNNEGLSKVAEHILKNI